MNYIFDTPDCKVSLALYDRVMNGQGQYFSKISHVDAAKWSADLLNPIKSLERTRLIERYAPIKPGMRALEIGAGCGVNLTVWRKRFGLDVYGVEPAGSDGFGSSFAISQDLLRDNAINPDRMLDAKGESLPFEDDTFDLIYSGNVLEHVDDPVRVLDEACRVLRPGGLAQFVYPNYHSCYDGHYSVIHPPVLFQGFFQWYVNKVRGRDPEFATTLNTQVNARWTEGQARRLQREFHIEPLSFGSEIFMERLTSLEFTPWGGLGGIHRTAALLGRLGLVRLTAKVMIAAKAWAPIFFTFRKPF